MATAKKTKTSAAKKATAKKAVTKRGRPPKGEAVRSIAITMRLTPAERTELAEKAETLGLTVTDLVVTATRAYEG